jgi:hypothetical protein
MRRIKKPPPKNDCNYVSPFPPQPKWRILPHCLPTRPLVVAFIRHKLPHDPTGIIKPMSLLLKNRFSAPATTRQSTILRCGDASYERLTGDYKDLDCPSISCQSIVAMQLPLCTLSTAAAFVAAVRAAFSLEDVCTSAHATAALPAAGFFQGITIDDTSVTANPVYSAKANSSVMYPDSTFDYCNVSFTYTHDGIVGDKVSLVYWLPSPTNFKNRFLSTGGGGYLSKC